MRALRTSAIAALFLVFLAGCSDDSNAPDEEDGAIAAADEPAPAAPDGPPDGSNVTTETYPVLNKTAILRDCLIDVQSYPVTTQSMAPHLPPGYAATGSAGHVIMQWRAWLCGAGELGGLRVDSINLGIAWIGIRGQANSDAFDYVIEGYVDHGNLAKAFADVGFPILHGTIENSATTTTRSMQFTTAGEPWFSIAMQGARVGEYEDLTDARNLTFSAFANGTFVPLTFAERSAGAAIMDEAATTVDASAGLFSRLEGPFPSLAGAGSQDVGEVTLALPWPAASQP